MIRYNLYCSGRLQCEAVTCRSLGHSFGHSDCRVREVAIDLAQISVGIQREGYVRRVPYVDEEVIGHAELLVPVGGTDKLPLDADFQAMFNNFSHGEERRGLIRYDEAFDVDYEVQLIEEYLNVGCSYLLSPQSDPCHRSSRVWFELRPQTKDVTRSLLLSLGNKGAAICTCVHPYAL